MARPYYTFQMFFDKHADKLSIKKIDENVDLKRAILTPEAEKPGVALTGHLKRDISKRILVLDFIDIDYLNTLNISTLKKRLSSLLSPRTPALILCDGAPLVKAIQEVAKKVGVPILTSLLNSTILIGKLNFLLSEEFALQKTCHGTLVEAFGVGVLMQGDSSIGKSEAALGLIERGHRLISDDVVKIRLLEGSYVEGFSPELTRHMMEIRGIGLINVAHLYGAVCVRDRKKIDLVIKLEEWDDQKFYDRIGFDEKYAEFLGIKIPFYILPVKPGRDVVLLIETIVLNHRLKEMGYDSAKEFNLKLIDTLANKNKRRHESIKKVAR